MTETSLTWNKVESIFATDCRLSLATTGGGATLISWLLNHPGASGCILEAQIPYHTNALCRYLGASKLHGCNRQTAREMAIRAYARACQFDEATGTTMGFGCTAALATSRKRRGDDRAFVALRNSSKFNLATLRFIGQSNRLEQEEVLSNYALHLICQTSGLSEESYGLPVNVEVEEERLVTNDPLDLMLSGHFDVVEIGLDGEPRIEVEREGRLLFPGSFNPLHEGHLSLAEVAEQQSGRSLSMEISVVNVDKPDLDRDEIDRRVARIVGRYPILVTRTPRFMDKAAEFANCHFVLGMDTAQRLLDGRYYQAGCKGVEETLTSIGDTGGKFFVAGRTIDDHWYTLDDLSIPAALESMFEAIPESAFHSELSSTNIRRGS